jgi:NADPH:quinone reductase-like Zn-dependent oxidoreductase
MTTMRAALISELGSPPAVADRAEPDDPEKAVVELRAAALNPVDGAIGSGRFPLGHPQLPYVPGVEGVGIVVRSGRFEPGTRVYACGSGLGIGFDGTFAERFAAPEASLYSVVDGVDDTQAVAFGTAGLAGWLPLTWLAPVEHGESVLVLGATGSVGNVAVQTAKLRGAGFVVAAGRDAARLERAKELGADASVALGPDFAERLADACGDRPPTLVLDGLWGEPLVTALGVAARGARIVHLGQSAGPQATVPSGPVRSKQLRIFGYSNFGVAPEDFQRGYDGLLAEVAAGRITLELDTLPLDEVGEAWQRQLAGGAKLVLTP